MAGEEKGAEKRRGRRREGDGEEKGLEKCWLEDFC
jgi:hypothetical protein